MTNRDALYEGYKHLTDDQHDPLERQVPGEPRFVLLGRDPTAADITRIWLALRKRDESLIDAIVKRLKATMMKVPYNPTKTPEHILSAQAIAIDMDLWNSRQRARTPGTEQDDAAAPDRMRTDYNDIKPDDAGAYSEQARLDAIKKAHPPAEPEN